MANELTYPQGFINAINNIQTSNNAYAVIHVIYPEGSICSCTKDNITLTAGDTSGEYWFGVPNDGEWTISCNDESDNTSKTILINQYQQVEEVQLSYLPDPGNILDNYSWEDISIISRKGVGDEYFDIGDCKAITLTGTIGNYLTLNNKTLYVFILDFNHPIDKTTADNNIIWGGFKTARDEGIDVALCDSGYGELWASSEYFNMNHYRVNTTVYNSNYGGWKGCDFRYGILGATSTRPSEYFTSRKSTSTIGYDATQATIDTPVTETLMAALPSDLRAVLRLWNRYIDYKGNGSNVDDNCSTATVDAISLLAEFEIFGVRTYANEYEQNHQKQMTYYSAGNSKIKYKHNATGTACFWWEASPRSSGATYFGIVKTDGSAYQYSSDRSYGLAPAFRT